MHGCTERVGILRRWACRLADVRFLNCIVPLLILYLVAGTVAQKYIGLYDATHIFFLSPLIVVSGFPLPGMPLMTGLLALCLFCHLIFKSPWRPEKAGSIVTHFGIIFLILTSLTVSAFSEEGYIELSEGETGWSVSDYHRRELVVKSGDNDVVRIPFQRIPDSGKLISEAGLPFEIIVVESCRNCRLERKDSAHAPPKREEGAGPGQENQKEGRNERKKRPEELVRLVPAALSSRNEENRAGLFLSLTAPHPAQGLVEKHYLLLEGIRPEASVEAGGKTYTLSLGKAKRPLPFMVKLAEFERQTYPGTDTPRSYHSDVKIIDKRGPGWESRISMNEPLRYKGYALFQSSFVMEDGKERSILAVVYNPVRSVLYLAGFIICAGMVLQLFLKYARFGQSTSARNPSTLIKHNIQGQHISWKESDNQETEKGQTGKRGKSSARVKVRIKSKTKETDEGTHIHARNTEKGMISKAPLASLCLSGILLCVVVWGLFLAVTDTFTKSGFAAKPETVPVMALPQAPSDKSALQISDPRPHGREEYQKADSLRKTDTDNNAWDDSALKSAPADLASFAKIAVLHEGRLKPMDSFARTMMYHLSGTEKSALQTLVFLLFTPAEMMDTPLIQVKNAETKLLLGLEKNDRDLYSPRVLQRAISRHQRLVGGLLLRTAKELTAPQQALVEVYYKLMLARDLMSSLTLFMPVKAVRAADVYGATSQLNSVKDAAVKPSSPSPAFAASSPGRILPLTEYTDFLTSYAHHSDIESALKTLIREKGAGLENYTPQEKALALFAFSLNELRRQGQGSRIFKVIPGYDTENYHTPWSHILEGTGGPASQRHFLEWRNLVRAYGSGENGLWQKTAKSLASMNEDSFSFLLETVYNRFQPVKLTAIIYFGVLMSLLGGFIMQKDITRGSVFLLLTGIIAHAAALLARITILERPPVGTLYESVLFVGLIIAAGALFLFAKDRQVIWLWASAMGGCLLQVLAVAQDSGGDNMEMLTAVLNTRFWLATHVLTITAGYGLCLLTSLLAHFLLIKEEVGKGWMIMLRKTALAALAMTSIGTVLGGVWADQSWGRFWGWDPKENGALLIILWLVWFIHMDVSATLGKRYVIAGYSYLSVIVGLSWFGVNLLSIGLHSYGFTDAMIWSLTLFVALETALIAAILTYRKSDRLLPHI